MGSQEGARGGGGERSEGRWSLISARVAPGLTSGKRSTGSSGPAAPRLQLGRPRDPGGRSRRPWAQAQRWAEGPRNAKGPGGATSASAGEGPGTNATSGSTGRRCLPRGSPGGGPGAAEPLAAPLLGDGRAGAVRVRAAFSGLTHSRTRGLARSRTVCGGRSAAGQRAGRAKGAPLAPLSAGIECDREEEHAFPSVWVSPCVVVRCQLPLSGGPARWGVPASFGAVGPAGRRAGPTPWRAPPAQDAGAATPPAGGRA